MARDTQSRRWIQLSNLLHDSRYALRQLGRAPAFTVTALLTLAFGIGANLGVFQLLYRVILSDLPIPHPDELVEVHAARTPFDQDWAVSYPAYLRLRASTPDIALIAGATSGEADLELPGRSMTKPVCELVSDNYFSGLQIAPAAGRLFIPADLNQSGGEWPAVLRYDFARDTFGSAAQAVGQHMLLNGRAFVVIGVAHQRFLGLRRGFAPDIFLPLALQSTGGFDAGFDSLGPGHDVTLSKPWYNQPTIFWLILTARIPPGHQAATLARWDQVFGPDRVLMTEATADPAVKAALLHANMSFDPINHGRGSMRKHFEVPLLLLMALSASIFLVGCLNLANLKLARLELRANELGVRMALGAGRGRLLAQVVLEDAILAIVGGALAVVVGRLSSGILVHWASSRSWHITIDMHAGLPIASLGAVLMLLSLVFFSIVPAVLFLRTGFAAHVAGSRARVSGITHSAGQRWRSNALLAAQVSLSLLLSTMSACFASTLVHWETVDVGMDRDHILSAHADMEQYRYVNHRGSLPPLYARMKQRLEALPGVRSAAVEMCGGIHCGWNTAIFVHDRSDLSNGQVHGQEDHVGPGFFSTVGIPLLRGRDFSATDTDTSQPVAIVSRSYARQLFGDNDPVGQWVGYEPAPNDHHFLIVGEVADARVNGPERDAPPMVYMAVDQNPAPIHSIQVRAAGDPSALAESVRQTLHEVDPALPIDEIVPFAVELNGDLGTEKLLARLASVYAGLTLLLVAIGFYGVLSSRTARRRSEFGIRLALGASRANIQALIFSQTGRILAAGIVPGAILSLLAVRTASHFLFGSVSANSLAIIAAALVLAVAGSIATLIPARRAAYSDPLQSLRSE